jgi:O-antigen ligase
MGDDETSQSRLTFWRDGLDIMQDRPVLGVGYSNWLPYYQRYYDPAGLVPHNIFIEAGAEMGYTGLLALLLLLGGTLFANARTRRRARALPEWGPFYRGLAYGLDAALVGYTVAGFFVTVLFYPFLWVNLSFTSALFLLVERRCNDARGRLVGGGRVRAHVPVAPGRPWQAS